jgi:hypothetical protein
LLRLSNLPKQDLVPRHKVGSHHSGGAQFYEQSLQQLCGGASKKLICLDFRKPRDVHGF